MKLGLTGLALVAMLFFSFLTGAQTNVVQEHAPLTAAELSKLKEVFADHLEDRVLNRPNVLTEIKDLLRNRVDIVELNEPRDQKPCKLLSEVALYKVFNPDIKRDESFDQSNFNPLKYAFNYRLKGASIYRVDNTDYFILIKARPTN